MHDHAASERRRQEGEAAQQKADLELERQVNLVLEGAVRRIADVTSGYGHREIARTAIAVVQKLRSKT